MYDETVILNRKDKGALAERLVEGLYSNVSDAIENIVRDHLQIKYKLDDSDFFIHVALADDLRRQNLSSLPGIEFPETTIEGSWRPDFVVRASWQIDSSEKSSINEIESSLPPHEIIHVYRGSLIKFSVYYPIEVKSGRKLTLTENQMNVIPFIDQEVDHVHPLIAQVDIRELPDQYYLKVEPFSESKWADGDSRY